MPPTSHSSKDLMPFPDIVNYLMLSLLSYRREGEVSAALAI